MWRAAAALALLTIAITWPLAARLTTALPGDYGDPLFVTWVMAWVADRATMALGDPASLGTFWDANIFFPEPDALAFSEHFIGQTLMVLPLYWISGNIVLGYNAAFLLSFLLSGLGTFLLTRALTGSAAGAAVAAFIVAFNEYRLVYEVAHLHVLSIHWLPFAVLALHRYAETDRRRWLIAAAAAIVLLNLSSVYYMAYAAPFIIVFAVVAVIRAGRVRQLGVWLELWAAAAAVAVLTLPFLLPYVEVQQRLAIVRSAQEVAQYSATLDHYRVALPGLVVPLLLASAGVVVTPRGRRWAVWTLAGFAVLAFWLSLGPTIHSGGRALAFPGLYGVLYDNVPGFSGLRVPARYAMLWFVFVGVLAGAGVAAIARDRVRVGAGVAAAALALMLWTTPWGMATNQSLPPAEGLAAPPEYLTPRPGTTPAIYRALERAAPDAVVVEFPFGDPAYELRYMFFAAGHKRRLMNGYSGVFPPSYLARKDVLSRPLLDPPRAAAALDGATHVVVHRGAWGDNSGELIAKWLLALGALPVAEGDGAILFALPVHERLAQK